MNSIGTLFRPGYKRVGKSSAGTKARTRGQFPIVSLCHIVQPEADIYLGTRIGRRVLACLHSLCASARDFVADRLSAARAPTVDSRQRAEGQRMAERKNTRACTVAATWSLDPILCTYSDCARQSWVYWAPGLPVISGLHDKVRRNSIGDWEISGWI